MAQNPPRKPTKKQKVADDVPATILPATILPEAPDDGSYLNYEPANPQDVSDDDLGLDDILAQLGTSKEDQPPPPPPAPPLSGDSVAGPPAGPTRGRVVVAKPVPLESRSDLAAAQAEENTVQALVASALRDSEEIGHEVLDKWRQDRAEVQETIDHLKDAVINRAVQNATGAVPAVYIESLVKALEVKGNMSLTAVKALDAKTRLLAAMKGSINIMNQQNNVAPSGDLERILAEPVDNDFANEP